MFFQFSPVRPEVKREPVRKKNESETLEILSLAPFTPNPKLFFEDVLVGETASRKLLIENPTNHNINLFIANNIPRELNVKLNPEQISVEKKSSAVLELTWQPTQTEFSRHNITIEDGKRIRRDVPVAFKSILPKKPKTGVKQGRKNVSKQKSSPTKKYYSTKPPYISPKKYSPPQKKYSPIKRYSPAERRSPTKKVSINIQKASPVQVKIRNATYIKEKENVPFSFNQSCDSNVFISPSSATFRLENLQPTEQVTERRSTYVVNGKKSSPSDSLFSDSLENISPDTSPLIEKYETTKRRPLGVYNQGNLSPNISEYIQQKLESTPVDYNFEYKLTQMESFCFTPVPTPTKRKACNPRLSSSLEKKLSLKSTTDQVDSTQLFPTENRTFEIPPKSPNISTETYVKNTSAETYVKGNTSFETYVKNNISGGTFTKDNSVGDVANLSFSPISTRSVTSPLIFKSNIDNSQILIGDSARQIIESNLWTGRNQQLSCIQEESYIQQSIRDSNHDNTNRSFLKRKSDLAFAFTPPKRSNVKRSPKEWSKTGGAPIRIAKKTTGLNLEQFLNNNTKTDPEAGVVITKQDTHEVIIQNPYLLAATNLADPFMTPHLYLNEEWLDQQQVDFKKWLNALLTPPKELNSEELVVDVAKVWQECKKREVDVAPTKELVSSKYMVNNKLNSLRKAAQTLFRSKEMSSVLSKVVLAVETGKLMIREDKDIHLNLALKSEVMSMLLSYNPLWLRIGLETVYNEIIPLKSNSDVVGLSSFIANRVLKDPYLLKKHKLPHSPKYTNEFKKFFLKKFLVLVYFLDQAKNKKLILHDPCLFCKNASIKESKEMLIRLAREMLAAVGDITKFLKYSGYAVTHVQTYIHEFDYAVNHLGVDLRDGVRLTKVMEIILMKENLTANLRVPAISRLQKVHNMKIVFNSLEKAGYHILYDISPKDIVDGHKEKTLSFLWQIVYKFEAPLMVKSATTIQAWFRSLPVVLKRRRFEKLRLQRETAASRIQSWYRRQKLIKKLDYFIALLEKYLAFVRNERAAVILQSYYRMYRCRKLYTKQRNTMINIQRFARGWLIRNIRRNQIKKSVIIQSNVRMYLARKRYLMLRNVTSFIQTKYRAKKQMEIAKSSYMQKKSSALIIQRWIRGIKLMRKEKNCYQELKTATLCIQQRFRANKLRKIERTRYLEIRSATITIQAWYRSVISMRICRERYLTMKKSVRIIEQRYIALKEMQTEKCKYQELRRACVTIQQRYRAQREMKHRRRSFLELQDATITLQRRYRANKASKIEKKRYENLKSTTLFIQRKFRAVRAMRIEYRNYNRLREAAVKIQVWFRASLEMRKCLTYYVSLKYAVHIFEDRYEAKKLMEKEHGYYKKLKTATTTLQTRYRALISMREARGRYLCLKTATIFIQRKFRANKLAQKQRGEYLKLKQAAVVIQRKYKAQLIMNERRNEYLELKAATISLQRQFRANCLMKTARTNFQTLKMYTLIVQQRYRANKAMARHRSDYNTLKQATVFIQQKWRAKKLGEDQRQRFEELKKTTLMIQRRWRANKLCREERTRYETLRKAAVSVQSRWRAKLLCEKQKASYMELKRAAIVLQNRWRAKLLKEQYQREYLELKKATIFVQRRWRSVKLTQSQRSEFVMLKKTVTSVQIKWRAKKLAQKERQQYLELKNAAIIIQSRWRAQKIARYQRNEYEMLKDTTIFIQRKFRANKLARQEKTRYTALKSAAITIQTRWRSTKVARRERNNYLQFKQATIVLQQRWRAKVTGRHHRQSYEALKKATLLTQRKWRANKLAKKEKTSYDTLRSRVINVQQLWRANKVCRIQKQSYLQLKNATVVIQNRWRAQVIGRKQKIQYESLRKATILVQRRRRANVLTKKERGDYLALRNAVVVIQSNWRRKQARKQYLELKKSAVTIQQIWRANKLRDLHCNNYKSLRKYAIFIQRRWRSNKLTRIERAKYQALKKAATVLQVRWRAKKQGAIDRNNYLLMKKAAVVFQQRWRAKKACQNHKKEYKTLRATVVAMQRKWRLKKLGEQVRNNYVSLRNAAIAIQNRWRARLLMKSAVHRYTLLKNNAIKIQRWYRACVQMKEQRKRYITTRTAALFIQKYYKGYLSMKQLRADFVSKRKLVLQVQKYIRGYLVRRKYAHHFTREAREARKIARIEKTAATKIQALWRGYRSRSIDKPELIKIRRRAEKANLKAEPQNTLQSRCRVALQALVNEKSTVSGVNKALYDLDYITRHSRDVCSQVAQFLPEQMYLMIKTTNRSLPEMTACNFSVNVLINVCKYQPTKPYSFFPEYIDNIITVMMHWCDKEAQLFPSMCTLLWLFADNPKWKEFIRSLPNIEQRFLKIQSQVLRKQSMVKRAGVKGQSVFSSYKSLPMPSLEPDWGLSYKHKPYVFTNSIHAFSSLLSILNL